MSAHTKKTTTLCGASYKQGSKKTYRRCVRSRKRIGGVPSNEDANEDAKQAQRQIEKKTQQSQQSQEAQQLLEKLHNGFNRLKLEVLYKFLKNDINGTWEGEEDEYANIECMMKKACKQAHLPSAEQQSILNAFQQFKREGKKSFKEPILTFFNEIQKKEKKSLTSLFRRKIVVSPYIINCRVSYNYYTNKKKTASTSSQQLELIDSAIFFLVINNVYYLGVVMQQQATVSTKSIKRKFQKKRNYNLNLLSIIDGNNDFTKTTPLKVNEDILLMQFERINKNMATITEISQDITTSNKDDEYTNFFVKGTNVYQSGDNDPTNIILQFQIKGSKKKAEFECLYLLVKEQLTNKEDSYVKMIRGFFKSMYLRKEMLNQFALFLKIISILRIIVNGDLPNSCEISASLIMNIADIGQCINNQEKRKKKLLKASNENKHKHKSELTCLFEDAFAKWESLVANQLRRFTNKIRQAMSPQSICKLNFLLRPTPTNERKEHNIEEDQQERYCSVLIEYMLLMNIDNEKYQTDAYVGLWKFLSLSTEDIPRFSDCPNESKQNILDIINNRNFRLEHLELKLENNRFSFTDKQLNKKKTMQILHINKFTSQPFDFKKKDHLLFYISIVCKFFEDLLNVEWNNSVCEPDDYISQMNQIYEKSIKLINMFFTVTSKTSAKKSKSDEDQHAVIHMNEKKIKSFCSSKPAEIIDHIVEYLQHFIVDDKNKNAQREVEEVTRISNSTLLASNGQTTTKPLQRELKRFTLATSP